MISNITIKNIKGYDAVGKSMDLTLLPNKINLVIAPNGFGKTSLTTAFDSLRPNGLEVAQEDRNREQMNGQPFLSITEDGTTYQADNTKNEISQHIAVHTIHSRLTVYASAKRVRTFSVITKYMKIQEIELCHAVRSTPALRISKAEKDMFGTKRLLLSHTLDILQNNLVFHAELRKFSHAFDVFRDQVLRGKMLDECMEYIVRYPGSSNALAANFDPHVFDKLEADEHYTNFANLYRLHTNENRLQTFVVFHQLLDIYKQDPRVFRKACEYAEYVRFKNFVNNEIRILNSSWKDLALVERDGKLFVEYPKARNISNGQRDVLTFIVDLICCDAKIEARDRALIIIDEIFDYLDDANILVAQYYLTKLLTKYKDRLYVVWLTHLAQDNFRSKILNKKTLHVQYLKPVQAIPNESMKKFIALREKLHNGSDAEQVLYNNISHYILHYAPEEKDLTEDLRACNVDGLRVTWGRRSVFHAYLIEELNKYLQESDDYDPYAVAVAIRLKSELNVYNSLNTDEQRRVFVDTNETKKKFEKMEEDYGTDIQVSYYVIASIHNEADHIRFDASGNIPDASIVYKLDHLVVKNIVKELFGYQEGVIITNDALR